MRLIAIAIFPFLLASSLRAATLSVSLGPDALTNSGALSKAIQHANVDDVVTIGEGRFPIMEPITLKNGVGVAGVGQSKTILLASFGKPGPMIYGSGLSSVEIHGFTLDGNGSGLVTQGIALAKSRSLDVHDITIQNIPGSDNNGGSIGPHGIFCTAAVVHSAFDHITCHAIGPTRTWGGGVRLAWNSIGNHVTNCTIDTTGRGGIFCNDGSTDNVISDNTVTASGGVGLGIEVQNCDRSLIERNTIDHWLSVDNSSTSAVRNNTIGTTDGTYKLCGIEVVDSHDIVATGNSVTGGEKVGLSISGAAAKTRLYFAGNLFSNATTWGTQIEGDAGGASELFFDNNRFIETHVGPKPLYANQGHGVRFNGNVKYAVFTNNEIAHNAGVGLQVTGDNICHLVFLANSLLDNTGGTIDSDAVPHLTWQGNHAVPAVPSWDSASENVTVGAGTISAATSPSVSNPASFTVSPPTGLNAATWLWDFGDGPPATGASVTHTFAHSGTSTVTAIGWDQNGVACRASAQVTVSP